jgi:hypothetical protein
MFISSFLCWVTPLLVRILLALPICCGCGFGRFGPRLGPRKGGSTGSPQAVRQAHRRRFARLTAGDSNRLAIGGSTGAHAVPLLLHSGMLQDSLREASGSAFGCAVQNFGLIWFDLVRVASKAIDSSCWLYQSRLGWMGLDYQCVSHDGVQSVPSAELAECGMRSAEWRTSWWTGRRGSPATRGRRD